jgi:hypothetical protein
LSILRLLWVVSNWSFSWLQGDNPGFPRTATNCSCILQRYTIQRLARSSTTDVFSGPLACFPLSPCPTQHPEESC